MHVLLARWMGATQYGTYDYIISIATFLGFLAALGLPNCLLRYIPKYSVEKDWGKLRGIVWGSWRYVSISAVVYLPLLPYLLYLSRLDEYRSRSITFFIWYGYNSSLGVG